MEARDKRSDEKFLADLFSMDKEKQAMVKGFVAGLLMTSDELHASGKDPPMRRVNLNRI